MDVNETTRLCDDWLSSWSGNKPEKLIEFFSEDVLYRDPLYPAGIQGKKKLKEYFEKLLSEFPDWQWTREELFPTENGFTLKWKATLGNGRKFFGLDIVERDSSGKISRNEVYFNPLVLDLKFLKGSFLLLGNRFL